MGRNATVRAAFIGFGALCIASAAYGAKVEIALEAELAQEIVAPLVVNAIKDVDKLGPKPDEPSNGLFVWAPGAPLVGGANDGKGLMRFVVNIPSDGEYAIWGRVVAWDGNSDSFWVVVRPADPDENPQQTGNVQFRWGVGQGGLWHWNRINHWLDGGTFARKWKLPKGEAEIRIMTREDATMLDSLFITSDLSADEGQVAPRVPTKNDIELQKLGGGARPVDPVRKLATVWAALRN